MTVAQNSLAMVNKLMAEKNAPAVAELEKQLRRYTRKLARAKERAFDYKEKPGEMPVSDYYTYFGGWSIGYYDSMISTLEDVVEDLTDILKLLKGES